MRVAEPDVFGVRQTQTTEQLNPVLLRLGLA